MAHAFDFSEYLGYGSKKAGIFDDIDDDELDIDDDNVYYEIMMEDRIREFCKYFAEIIAKNPKYKNDVKYITSPDRICNMNPSEGTAELAFDKLDYSQSIWYKVKVNLLDNNVEIWTFSQSNCVIIDSYIYDMIMNGCYKVSKLHVGRWQQVQQCFGKTYQSNFQNVGADFQHAGIQLCMYQAKAGKAHPTIDEKFVARLEDIELPAPSKCGNLYDDNISLRYGYYFQSPEVFGRFMAWCKKYGYTQFTEYVREGSSERTFLQNKWYNIQDRHRPNGGYWVIGKPHVVKHRQKRMPLAPDFIIESGL